MSAFYVEPATISKKTIDGVVTYCLWVEKEGLTYEGILPPSSDFSTPKKGMVGLVGTGDINPKTNLGVKVTVSPSDQFVFSGTDLSKFKVKAKNVRGKENSFVVLLADETQVPPTVEIMYSKGGACLIGKCDYLTELSERFNKTEVSQSDVEVVVYSTPLGNIFELQ
jgi:co-chaperonin GroES (HSP10)